MTTVTHNLFVAQVIAEEGLVAIRATRPEALKVVADWVRARWDETASALPESDQVIVNAWFDLNADDSYEIACFKLISDRPVPSEAISFSVHGQATTTPPYAYVDHPWLRGDDGEVLS